MMRLGWLPSVAFVIVAFLAMPSPALENVVLRRDGEHVSVQGTVVVEAQDGGLLLQDRAGVLWLITPDEIVRRDSDETAFAWLGKEEMAEELQREFPGFRVHTTAHYLLAYNTSPAYAEWCGALFERLHLAFTNYWRQRGLELQEPPGPLVALVFDGQPAYRDYSRKELRDAAGLLPGYYSLQSNRVVTYDLTGTEGTGGNSGTTAAHINRILSQPGAEGTVATIIHEATHQLAFNSGLHTRFADIPLWVSEGIAIYFETPDLSSKRGWRTIGGVNRARLSEFRKYLASRPADSLTTLLSTHERFRQTRTASAAYAEAWALNYFLLRKHGDEYTRYLQFLSEKLPLRDDAADERLAQFKKFFGPDLDRLDAEFLRYMRTVR